MQQIDTNYRPLVQKPGLDAKHVGKQIQTQANHLEGQTQLRTTYFRISQGGATLGLHESANSSRVGLDQALLGGPPSIPK